MAKPTKYATPTCIVLSVLVIAGILLGYYFKNPLLIVIFMLPSVIYEAYRTEGKRTRWASSLMAFLIIAELVLIIFKINFDLVAYLNMDEIYFRGNIIPLGDIKILFPVALALLSGVLFFRTYGIYTKWLAVIIFIGSFSIINLIDPEIFRLLLKSGVENNI